MAYSEAKSAQYSLERIEENLQPMVRQGVKMLE